MARRRLKADSMIPPPYWGGWDQFTRDELMMIQDVFNRSKFCGHESQKIADFLIKVKNLLSSRPGPLPMPEPMPGPMVGGEEPSIEPV